MKLTYDNVNLNDVSLFGIDLDTLNFRDGDILEFKSLTSSHKYKIDINYLLQTSSTHSKPLWLETQIGKERYQHVFNSIYGTDYLPSLELSIVFPPFNNLEEVRRLVKEFSNALGGDLVSYDPNLIINAMR